METATADRAVQESTSLTSRTEKLVAALRERGQTKTRCLEVLRGFSESLFHELTVVLETLRAQGVDVGEKPTLSPMSDGLQSLAFDWEGSRVIVSPVPLALPPPAESSAANAIAGPCGRIVLFLQPLAIHDTADAVYEIFISLQGRYIAEGLGIPSIGQIGHSHVQALAVAVFERLTFDIKRWHRSIDRTTFDFVSQGVREPIGFVATKPST